MAQSGGHAEVVERRFADLKSQLRPSELGQRYALPVVWGIVCLVFSILRPNTFPTTANFSTIFGTQAVLVVLALGLIIPLTAGDYDLSIAYNLTLSAMVVAILNVNYGWSIYWAILAALGVADPYAARGEAETRAAPSR